MKNIVHPTIFVALVSPLMSYQTPGDFYRQRIKILQAERLKIACNKNRIAWARLAVVIAGLGLFWGLKNQSLSVAVVAATLCFALFLRLVITAIRVSKQLSNTDCLISINEQELSIAAGTYQHLPDGRAYLPHQHPYAYDLDVLGRASLFQYVNRTTTQQGGHSLAQWLLQPAGETEIKQRQEAAKELAAIPEWSQQLQAHGKVRTISHTTQQRIEQWLAESNTYFTTAVWQVVRWLGPVVALTILALYIVDIIRYEAFFLGLFVLFLVSGFISKKATPTWHALSKIAPEIAALSALAKHIEEQPFKADWLQQKKDVLCHNTTSASAAIKELNGILSRLDYRLNPVAFVPLNIFLFWDLRQMLAFESWKKRNAEKVLQWFTTVGEIEALNSIAVLHFNHPEWCFPVISKRQGYFEAKALGHPLLPQHKVVRSSFCTTGRGQVAVITGSNMAGKSTFLRSVGLALVMGLAGMPVSASAAAFACMQVISTMRISDNLEESTSTFYAELKKLKDIIDAVNRNENVFLLLDEILRGTNSLDRHTGSKALIKQLIQHRASGIIATHDLALAALIEDYPESISNYHFDVQVAGEELYFDYKLKDGICQSLNASVLMKKIGIEM